MFVTPDLENVLKILDQLEENKTPNWGSLSPQGMVEHLTDTLQMAVGKGEHKLLIPEDKVSKMQAFLDSDKEMMRNIQVPFAPEERVMRNDELATAIDEFTEAWLNWEEKFTGNESLETLHPFYGMLNFEKWKKLHQKHLTHHFKQFGLM